MIGQQPKPSERKIERLKWEYIKKSSKYRKFCDWFHKKYIKEPFCGMHRLIARTNFGDIEHFDKRLPKEFRPVSDGNCKRINPIIDIYCIYGDIYNLNFDDFWKKRMKSRTTTRKMQKKMRIDHAGHHPVHDYIDSIEYDIQHALELYHDECGAESKPAPGNLKSYFERLWDDRNVKILMIDCERTDMEEIKEAAGHVLHGSLPKYKPEPNALRRYLDALIKRDEKKDKETIFKETRLGKEHHYKDRKRAVKRDIQFARQIIKNLENGYSAWWSIK